MSMSAAIKESVPSLQEYFFDSREAMLSALKKDVTECLQSALKDHERVSFMVSGGSSPEPLYRALSRTELPWNRISAALVDERWVPKSHPKSNEAFIEENLLQSFASATDWQGMKNFAPTADEGQAFCEGRYRWLPPHWAVTILGMGNDGHTASLFPHAKGLEAALDEKAPLCAAIEAIPSEVTGEITERITLTLPALLRSQQLILLLTGEEKLATYKAAKAGDDIADMPVRAILQQSEAPVAVYWAP